MVKSFVLISFWITANDSPNHPAKCEVCYLTPTTVWGCATPIHYPTGTSVDNVGLGFTVFGAAHPNAACGLGSPGLAPGLDLDPSVAAKDEKRCFALFDRRLTVS